MTVSVFEVIVIKNEVRMVIFIKAQIMSAIFKDYCVTVWIFSNVSVDD